MRLNKIEFARKLRKEGTATEKLVWDRIKKKKLLGFKFRRQHIIRGFILDFYCHELNLALEIDGGIHGHQKEYDRVRQEIIEGDGVEFLRIDVMDIEHAIPLIVDKIQCRERELARLAATGSPSPIRIRRLGEGLGERVHPRRMAKV